MQNRWRRWIPILNVKDARASADFYCGILGFAQDWAHRFDDGFPLYVSLSRDDLTLHLSEHGDDSTHITLASGASSPASCASLMRLSGKSLVRVVILNPQQALGVIHAWHDKALSLDDQAFLLDRKKV